MIYSHRAPCQSVGVGRTLVAIKVTFAAAAAQLMARLSKWNANGTPVDRDRGRGEMLIGEIGAEAFTRLQSINCLIMQTCFIKHASNKPNKVCEETLLSFALAAECHPFS